MTSIGRVAFLGSKPLGLKVLETIHRLRPECLAAVVSFDDRSDQRSSLNGFRDFATKTGIPLFVAVNATHADQILRDIRPDLCLVACWYWMLKDDLIATMPNGAIGIHNSLLPKYRGGSPLVWSMLNGEPDVGFSVFSLTPEMDAGPIWFQERVVRLEDAGIAQVLASIEALLVETLEAGWCDLLDGKIRPHPQNDLHATYCAQRIPDDGAIDWRWGAKEIVDFVRAQSSPYPGAFTIVNGKKVTLLNASVWKAPYFGRPGQVAISGEEGVVVICGNNRAIEFREVVHEGAVRPAKELFNSIKIRL